jgi:hypothetical protein
MMDFANERYVRLYVRDTITWLRLKFEGQTILALMLRKADRAGVIDMDPDIEPWEAAMLHLPGCPEPFAKLGMGNCLKQKCIVHDGDRLVFPRYIEANETPMSDKQRAKESRAKRALLDQFDQLSLPLQSQRAPSQSEVQASRFVTPPSQIVMPASHAVTPRHAESHAVTPCRTVPYRAVPSSLLETNSSLSKPDTSSPDARARAGCGVGVGVGNDNGHDGNAGNDNGDGSSPPAVTQVTQPESFDSSDVVRIFSALRKAARRGSYRLQHTDYQRAQTAVEWALEQAADTGESPEFAVTMSVTRFLNFARGKEGEGTGWPFWGWAHDPGKWHAMAAPMGSPMGRVASAEDNAQAAKQNPSWLEGE